MLSVAIMQPYWFPYVGYFQLAAHVDMFVVYDRIEYTKRGWFNRNRVLSNSAPRTITVPLSKAQDHACVSDRRLAEEFPNARRRLINILRNSYQRAPHFESTMELLKCTLDAEAGDPFMEFVWTSLVETVRHIGLGEDRLVRSSQIEGDQPVASGQERVVQICQRLGATRYLNPIGGHGLYDEEYFKDWGVDLRFLQFETPAYEQMGPAAFIPKLSIIDILMHLGPTGAHAMALLGTPIKL